MFAALRERLERTGAAGEILQAIGVGSAVVALAVWSIFWGGAVGTSVAEAGPEAGASDPEAKRADPSTDGHVAVIPTAFRPVIAED